MTPIRSLVACTALLSLVGVARADTPRIRIQAGTQLVDAGTLAGDGYVDVRGRVLDDVGRPLAETFVTLAFSSGAPFDARACDAFSPPAHAPAGFRLKTDDAGTFCMRVDAIPPGVTASISSESTPYFAALDATFSLKPERTVGKRKRYES